MYFPLLHYFVFIFNKFYGSLIKVKKQIGTSKLPEPLRMMEPTPFESTNELNLDEVFGVKHNVGMAKTPFDEDSDDFPQFYQHRPSSNRFKN